MNTDNIYRMIRIGGPARPQVNDLLAATLSVQNKSDLHMLIGFARAMISDYPRYPVPVSVDTTLVDAAVETLIECAEMISDDGLSVLIKEAQKCMPRATTAKVFEFPKTTGT